MLKKNPKMYFYKIGGASSQSIRAKNQFGGRVTFVLQADGQRYKFMLTLLDLIVFVCKYGYP